MGKEKTLDRSEGTSRAPQGREGPTAESEPAGLGPWGWGDGLWSPGERRGQQGSLRGQEASIPSGISGTWDRIRMNSGIEQNQIPFGSGGPWTLWSPLCRRPCQGGRAGSSGTGSEAGSVMPTSA